MNDFFPTEDYKIPSTSNYMKFLDGENSFRVLSSAIVGYEYFNRENKPIRSKVPFDELPEDIKKDGRINHFWAFVVWNYNEKKVQVLELTQKGIMKTMQAYIKNPKWGNPREYDFIVNRTGNGLDTEYAVTVNPKSVMDEMMVAGLKNTKVNLDNLFEGKDPFSKENHTNHNISTEEAGALNELREKYNRKPSEMDAEEVGF